MTVTTEVDLTGKVAVVTGATGGIGKQVAQGLARLGATVVIGSRDRGRGEAVRDEIGAAAALTLDVADLASIRTFAGAFRDEYPALDVLVNNAGAWFTDRKTSPQGFELTFATNTLGPYLLTELLLDALRVPDSARVINIVSSVAGSYDPSDLQFTRRPYDGYQAYSQSKQALHMLTWGQAARFGPLGVTANAVAPGFVRTGLNRNVYGARAAMIKVSARLFGVQPEKGADAPLWAASAPELAGVTGKYFSGRKEREAKYRDPDAIADLERRCEEMAASGSGG